MADTRTDRSLLNVVVWAGVDDEVPSLAALGAGEVVVAGPDAIEREVENADVVLVSDFASHNAERVWRNATRARWIHMRGTGVDHLLTPTLVAHPAVLTNGRGCFDRTIAEFVLTQLLALAKEVPSIVHAQSRASWEPRLTQRLDNVRVLVIGPGAIGTAIARLLHGVGVQVDGAGREERPGRTGFGRIRSTAGLASYVGDYDYVVVAAPLTAETHHLVSADVLDSMKRSARLINTARGAIVDEAALVTALADGTIGGAALDVFETEPLPSDSPLWTMPNVLVTPHMAGDFVGWRQRQYELFADNFARFAEGRPLRNVIDKSLGYVATDDEITNPDSGPDGKDRS